MEHQSINWYLIQRNNMKIHFILVLNVTLLGIEDSLFHASTTCMRGRVTRLKEIANVTTALR